MVASLAEAWIETPCRDTTANWTWSPPSRRRGLKHRDKFRVANGFQSPPSRRRGLKRENILHPDHAPEVASLAEAWIETSIVMFALPDSYVASLAGAWIETRRMSPTCHYPWSPPSRRRGLKHRTGL